MTQAKPRFSTFEEYLSYDDGTDKRYELFNGELIELPPESPRNVLILSFVHFQLVKLVGHRRVLWGVELQVRGEIQNRFPDLTVIDLELVQQLTTKMAKRSTITLEMLPPLLVIEAVSPGNRNSDYIDKRAQYQNRGIPEYWLIDPAIATVTVLKLVDGIYQELCVSRGTDPISSLIIPGLSLTANQIFEAGQ